MYLPARFKIDDPQAALELMAQKPLMTVVSVENGEPYISHIPLIAEPEADRLVLTGHMARANPHVKTLDGKTVTVICHGPNAYITPNWYAHNDVPTWNYAVVHMTGKVHLLEDYQEIVDSLRKLTDHVEKNSPHPWEFWLPEDLSDPHRLTRSIVGIKILVQKVEAKFKLNQGRSKSDHEGVIKGLQSERSDEMSRDIAILMSRFVV